MSDDNIYWGGYFVTWIILFVGCWIYSIASYGFLLGVSLGWIPSLIVASLISFLWPFIALAIIVLGIILYRS